MSIEKEIRKKITEISHLCWDNKWVASNDGNISVKINNKIFITPTLISKKIVSPEVICVTDLDGNLIGKNKSKPSSEIKLHLKAYAKRDDIFSVVHMHPPYATAHAVAGIPLEEPLMTEIVSTIGKIPLAPYGTPSTNEVPDSIDKIIEKYDSLLLSNHGAMTCGKDIMDAYYKMEALEHFAKIRFIAFNLGKFNIISDENIKKIQKISNNQLTC